MPSVVAEKPSIVSTRSPAESSTTATVESGPSSSAITFTMRFRERSLDSRSPARVGDPRDDERRDRKGHDELPRHPAVMPIDVASAAREEPRRARAEPCKRTAAASDPRTAPTVFVAEMRAHPLDPACRASTHGKQAPRSAIGGPTTASEAKSRGITTSARWRTPAQARRTALDWMREGGRQSSARASTVAAAREPARELRADREGHEDRREHDREAVGRGPEGGAQRTEPRHLEPERDEAADEHDEPIRASDLGERRRVTLRGHVLRHRRSFGQLDEHGDRGDEEIHTSEQHRRDLHAERGQEKKGHREDPERRSGRVQPAE